MIWNSKQIYLFFTLFGLIMIFFEGWAQTPSSVPIPSQLPSTSSASSPKLEEKQVVFGPPTTQEQLQASIQDHPSRDQLEGCADCHLEIVESFKQTFMSRALTYPTLDQVIEDFSLEKSVVIHPVTQVGYRAFIDDQGRWWQEEFDPQSSYSRRVEVTYLIGSGNNTRSYIGEIDGELFELPLTWYSATSDHEGLWDMSPGYQRADHFRFSRPVKADCLFCHNDLSPTADHRLSGFKERLPPGITCVRCHGDGKAHTEARFAGQEWPNQPDPTILNPAHLSPQRQLQICEQCHLSGEARALLPNQRWDHYDPRTPFEDYVRIYAFPVSQIQSASGNFGIASHAERMVLSACTQGAKTFTCTTCHNPHAPDSVESYQKACMSCHQHQEHAQKYERSYQKAGKTHLNNLQKKGKPCFSCHMRSSGTSDIPHVKMTDHWVQRQPHSDHQIVTYEPHLKALLPELRPELQTYQEGLLGLSYADLVRYNQKSEHLPKAIRLLAQAAQKHPDWPELWSALGELSSMIGDRIATIAAYQKYSELRPHDEHYRLREASTLNVQGQLDEASQVLNELIKFRPNHHQALESLANIELQRGHYQKAEHLYQQADRYGSHAHSIAHNRGFLALIQGDLKQARKFFEEGVRRDGISREAPFNLGVLSATEGNHEQAISYYRRALVRDRLFRQAYQQLVRSLLILKREDEAIETLRTWVKLDPNSVDALLMLVQQLDRMGNYQEVYDLLNTAQHLKDPRMSAALKIASERLKLIPSQQLQKNP